MGALVLAQPMFRRIRQKYPDASTFVLLFQQNREVLDLLNAVPQENILTVRNTSLAHFLKDSLHAIRCMRRWGIDTVLDCELFSRASAIFSIMSRATMRVGFHPHTQEGLFRGDFINRPVLYNPYQHISRQFLTQVEAIESSGAPKVKRPVEDDDLELYRPAFDQDEVDAAWTRLETDFPRIVGKKVILVYPGGGLLPIRAWPLSHFCRLAEELARRDFIVAVIGLRRDKETAHAIVSHCNSTNCIDLTGYTHTVRELVLLFHRAALLISNDGGPGHFASLTPVPSIIFYGPETPALYGPLDDKSLTLFAKLSCSPCLTAYNHRNSPCDGRNVCLDSIHPDRVLKEAMKVLNRQEASSKM
jgi:ADP-heptose:LPS heptosyltransferase